MVHLMRLLKNSNKNKDLLLIDYIKKALELSNFNHGTFNEAYKKVTTSLNKDVVEIKRNYNDDKNTMEITIRPDGHVLIKAISFKKFLFFKYKNIVKLTLGPYDRQNISDLLNIGVNLD